MFRQRDQAVIVRLLFLSIILGAMIASVVGSFSIPATDLLFGSLTELQRTVWIEIRLPRVILSGLVGASLGLSGAALQGLFRNPLADPGLIGVSAGAALGAAIVIVLTSDLSIPSSLELFLLPLAGIIGASMVTLLLFLFSRGFGYQGVTYLLLIGIAVNAIASVGIGILTYISTDSELRSLTFWTMGSFGGVTWSVLVPAMFLMILSFFFMIPARRTLDILQLGEIEAYRLGVDVKKVKYRVIFSSATAVGASVAISGMIGFVGLVIPHLARLIGGVNHNYLLPASAALGAFIMISADVIARMVIQPAELPIGLITSAIGSPFFLWLIFRMKKRDY